MYDGQPLHVFQGYFYCLLLPLWSIARISVCFDFPLSFTMFAVSVTLPLELSNYLDSPDDMDS